MTLETDKDYGDVIKALKKGKVAQRKGWNGKNMFIYRFVEKDWLPTYAFKTAQGSFLKGWLASQTDMDAEDWSIADSAEELGIPDQFL